jgi:hypothetical protein
MITSTPRQTTVRRQPRPADPDLARLDRRILSLEGRGRGDPAAACRVVRLRTRYGHLLRDRAAGGAQWLSEARNLELAVGQEEGNHA